MTKDVHNVEPNSEISEVSKKMCDCQIKRIPVVENEEVVGIVTLGDLANNDTISSSDVGSTTKEICNCNDNHKITE